jgi:hypothetical protein
MFQIPWFCVFHRNSLAVVLSSYSLVCILYVVNIAVMSPLSLGCGVLHIYVSFLCVTSLYVYDTSSWHLLLYSRILSPEACKLLCLNKLTQLVTFLASVQEVFGSSLGRTPVILTDHFFPLLPRTLKFTEHRWDFRFSWQQVWRLSSGLLRLVVWKKFTDISEVFAVSIIRVMSKPHTRNWFLI